MDRRSEYIERLAASVREWDGRIDGMRLKMEKSPPEKRVFYRRAVLELIERRDEGVRLLDRLREADEADLGEVEREADRLVDFVTKMAKAA